MTTTESGEPSTGTDRRRFCSVVASSATSSSEQRAGDPDLPVEHAIACGPSQTRLGRVVTRWSSGRRGGSGRRRSARRTSRPGPASTSRAPTSQLDLGADLVGGGVDAQQLAGVLGDHPDRVEPSGHALRPGAGLDRRDHLAGGRVEPQQHVAVERRHPDRSVSRGGPQRHARCVDGQVGLGGAGGDPQDGLALGAHHPHGAVLGRGQPDRAGVGLDVRRHLDRGLGRGRLGGLRLRVRLRVGAGGDREQGQERDADTEHGPNARAGVEIFRHL